ncbi:MAG: transcriptional regulator [Leptolyngbyaceae cyanobacterium SM1_4_3]|nr:transcriptional regulator [Leptolyngbyaceae cyanobacterium SM1_4_3]
MTTGLKTPSSYYMELINAFPPRPITNDAELNATQNQINSILDRGRLTQDDRDYLKVLGMLVYDYEEQCEQMPTLKGIKLLKALMAEANLEPKDLVPIFGDESVVLEILNHRSEPTDTQIQKLALFFHISPASFARDNLA